MSWIPDDLSELLARREDPRAVEELLRALQDPIYGLALRMLADPDDAADATQEILLRVATHLDAFRGESSFATWVYRVAANQLLTARARRAEATTEAGTFAQAAAELEAALAMVRGRSSDDQVLIDEVKLYCTHGMLLALDRPHRLAYLLGEILELASEEGAEVLAITAEAFRKRLSRARLKLEEFLRGHCGLVNQDAVCRCAKLVAPSVELGIVDPNRLRYVSRARAEELRREIDAFADAAALFRSQPRYVAPPRFVESLRALLGHKFGDHEV